MAGRCGAPRLTRPDDRARALAYLVELAVRGEDVASARGTLAELEALMPALGEQAATLRDDARQVVAEA